VRQSTNTQVLHHQESTERQYALRAMARELGWSESAIRTLDRDLGMTGTEMTRREDFKTLVADVSMGQVGVVFALEVSRRRRHVKAKRTHDRLRYYRPARKLAAETLPSVLGTASAFTLRLKPVVTMTPS
jgi:DNA invertase Pin-like site-specific DNA recombinase